VERLGFDSIFITDHVIAAKHFYDVSWLDPLTTLSFVAAVTQRVRLGTSILILPLRHPVILAKQIATLEYLSRDRYIIGGGVGWFEPEFEAVGTHKRERGRRTDEVLDIVSALLTRENVSYDGEFYSINDITIDPRPSRMPPVWIGGGSQLASDKSPEPPRFAETVMARVARSDGWIPRPTSPPEQIASDWVDLSRYLTEHGRDPAEIAVVHENFLHYVPSGDRERVLRAQHEAYAKVMSEARGDDYLESVYLFGTPDEIIDKLQARVNAGVQYFVLHTMTPDPAQLELWLRDVIPNVRFPSQAPHPGRLAAAGRS
jgi:probable F420-dependent oxidoreductase